MEGAAPALPVPDGLVEESRCASPPFHREEHPAYWYSWVPSTPLPPGCAAPPPWSPATFCAALAGRKLLLVGDSMTWTFHDATLSALLSGEHAVSMSHHTQWNPCPHGGHPICVAEAAATAALPPGHPAKVVESRLTYIRNDRLSLVDKANEVRGDIAWKHLVDDNTLLILNTGAHPRDHGDLATDVLSALDWVETHVPNAGVVYRSTAPAHDEGVLDPVNYRAQRAALRPLKEVPSWPVPGGGRVYYDITKNHTWEWGWIHMHPQNEMVAKLIAARAGREGGIGVLHLDVWEMTGKRPDHHKDNLHYCIPGPVDWWLVLLGWALQAERAG